VDTSISFLILCSPYEVGLDVSQFLTQLFPRNVRQWA